MLPVMFVAWDPGYKPHNAIADDTEPKSQVAHAIQPLSTADCMVNYKSPHELPSKSKQHQREDLPIMRVAAGTADRLTACHTWKIASRETSRHPGSSAASRGLQEKWGSMVPSRNANLAIQGRSITLSVTSQHIPVAMHVLTMYNPHFARSVDHWRQAVVGKISPITAVNYRSPASPPSTSGIVDKFQPV